MSEQVSKGSKRSSNDRIYPILAIDHGEKRFGIAISDQGGVVATSLETLSISKRTKREDIIKMINEIAIQNRAASILLGLPQAFEKSHESSRDRIHEFGRELERSTGLNVYYYDESYSTQRATDLMLQSGTNRSRRKYDRDSVAAALFLQEFLDAKNTERA